MTALSPRLARRTDIPWLLCCGFPRCNGQVGRLDIDSVRRTFPVPLPEALMGDPPSFRELIETQAPEGARCAVAFRLPEGFARAKPSPVWSRTRRARLRESAIRRKHLPRSATHRHRPEALGADLHATVPPLPAEVRCPECGRINMVTLDLLATFLQLIADRWSTDATGETESFAGSLVRQHEPMRAARLRGEPGSGPPPGEPALPRDVVTETMFGMPQVLLIGEARYLGRPIQRDDFFVVQPDRPHMVSGPDPELHRAIVARAEATPQRTRRPRRR